MPSVYCCPKCADPAGRYGGETDYCEEHRPAVWRLWDVVLSISDERALKILGTYAAIRRGEDRLPPSGPDEYAAIKALEENMEMRTRAAKARADAAAGVYANPLGRSWMSARFPPWKARFFAYYAAWIEAGGDPNLVE